MGLGTDAVSWEDWWTYDGISGPSFWGLINPEWSLCNAGRMQSPINVDPKGLLYDHTLANINLGSDKTNGHVFNTGHGVSFLCDLGINEMVNISGGPLSYNYPIYDVSLHFGLRDDQGSEHTIDGEHFAGELQLLGYNADLYDNYTTASNHPNGLVGVVVLIQVGTYSNSELRKITDAAMSVQYRGDRKKVENVTISNLLPETIGYMTYEGSQTAPGCSEVVNWIIINKPIYITQKQVCHCHVLLIAVNFLKNFCGLENWVQKGFQFFKELLWLGKLDPKRISIFFHFWIFLKEFLWFGNFHFLGF